MQHTRAFPSLLYLLLPDARRPSRVSVVSHLGSESYRSRLTGIELKRLRTRLVGLVWSGSGRSSGTSAFALCFASRRPLASLFHAYTYPVTQGVTGCYT
jgi:hypothetical protein